MKETAKTQSHRLERTLTSRFAAFLKPGERISVEMEIDGDYLYNKWVVATPSMESRLDVEAALIAQEQEYLFLHENDTAQRLQVLLAFLESQLSDYFRQSRRQRFHIDWRIYPFDEAKIRFRGEWSSPNLEERANALLGPGEEERD
ncbi:MAG: hypothetical protein ACNA8W_22785 [Bradymonadaceae bacterium]